MNDSRQIGKYRLTEKIGEGGMAEVWKCVDTGTGETYAIKFLIAGLAGVPEVEHRFLHEGKRLGALSHPNIVAAVDFLSEDGRNYLVMQYVEGITLEDWIDRIGGPFPLQHVVTIARGVLAGLGFAHRSGVVHRDVKPANILINRQGVPMLTDFGIALAVGQKRLTRTGTVMGTPHYMSPEQIMSPSAVGPRSDLYNFGVVLYELLTGWVPFDAEEGDVEYYVKSCHLQTPPPPLRQLNPEISQAMEAVVLCALAKRQEQRFATCEELMSALEAAMTGIMPQPPATAAPALVPQAPTPTVKSQEPPAEEVPPTRKIPPAGEIPLARNVPPAHQVPPAGSVPPTREIPPAQEIPLARNVPPGPQVPPAGSVPTHQVPPANQVPPPRKYQSKAPLVAALALFLLLLIGGGYAAYHFLYPRLFGPPSTTVVTLPPDPPPSTPIDPPSIVETPPPSPVAPAPVPPAPVPPAPVPPTPVPIDRPKPPPVKPDPPPPTVITRPDPPVTPPPPIENPPVTPVIGPPVNPPPVNPPVPPVKDQPKPRVPVFRPDPPPVKPMEPPKPVYQGPRSGSFQWSVQLRKDALFSLVGHVPSDGTVSGQLPPAGFPYEIVSIAHRDVGVQQAPGPSNGWNRLVLRSMKNQNVVVSLTWKLLE